MGQRKRISDRYMPDGTGTDIRRIWIISGLSIKIVFKLRKENSKLAIRNIDTK